MRIPKHRRVAGTQRGGPEVAKVIEEDVPESAVHSRSGHRGCSGRCRRRGFDPWGRADGGRPSRSGGRLRRDRLSAREQGGACPRGRGCLRSSLRGGELPDCLWDVASGRRGDGWGAGSCPRCRRGRGAALLELGRLAELKMYGTASEYNHDLVTSPGATPIDYRNEDFVEVIRRFTGDGGGCGIRPLWRRKATVAVLSGPAQRREARLVRCCGDREVRATGHSRESADAIVALPRTRWAEGAHAPRFLRAERLVSADHGNAAGLPGGWEDATACGRAHPAARSRRRPRAPGAEPSRRQDRVGRQHGFWSLEPWLPTRVGC